MRKLTDQQKIEIVEKYKTGNYTCSSLGREYNVRSSSINSILRVRGIDIINDMSILKRKYPFNEKYFDSIDSEAKAYFLGLLCADGCNMPKTNRINISLQEEDKDILTKFNQEIGSNRPLFFIDYSKKMCKNQYMLGLNSKHMSESLIKLNCVPRKSLILEFPTTDQVPEHLIRHFIRGYFDGDGSFSYKIEHNYFDLRANIVSTENFVCKLKSLLFNILNIEFKTYITSKDKPTTTRKICIAKTENTYRFLYWLYNESNFYLDRKYQKFLKVTEQLNKHCQR